MDKEIKKWKKKHTEAIRASMANPGMLSSVSYGRKEEDPMVKLEKVTLLTLQLSTCSSLWSTLTRVHQ